MLWMRASLNFNNDNDIRDWDDKKGDNIKRRPDVRSSICFLQIQASHEWTQKESYKPAADDDLKVNAFYNEAMPEGEERRM